MAQYVNKDALVAEITRRKTNIKEYCLQKGHDERFDVVPEQLAHILSFIDTLEVKEVDLDSNIRAYLTNYYNVYEDGVLQSKKNSQPLSTYDIIKVAKHFFEFGLQVQKGE